MPRMIKDRSFWMGALGCLVCFGLLQLISNLPWVRGQAISASPEKGPSESRSGPVAVTASAPRLIPFQAYLTDTNGRPVEGQHNLTFKLYDVTESGSDLGWTETHTNVPVSKGMVNVLLGNITPFGSLAFDTTRYVGVSVDGGLEMVPRQQIIPAIQAVDADRAKESEHAVASDQADKLVIPGSSTPAVTVASNGNVGIGTTEPRAKLDVQGGGLILRKEAGLFQFNPYPNPQVLDTVYDYTSALYIVHTYATADSPNSCTYLVLFSSSYYGCVHSVIQSQQSPQSGPHPSVAFTTAGSSGGLYYLKITPNNMDTKVRFAKISLTD